MPPSKIRFLPVAFFSMVMGLTGFALAMERASEVLGLPAAPGKLSSYFAGAVFVALAAAYGIKLAGYRDEVSKELNHPVKLSFFPTISISLVLLSIAFHAHQPALSFCLFALGAPLQLGFTLFVLSRWISHTVFEIHHSNPSWFIPVVGNILVPIAAVAQDQHEIGWFFFSIGLVFWLVLLTIILYRVIFHPPFPTKLAPTFFILIAPPAVGFISYINLTGSLDAFGRILYYSALFTVLLLLALHRMFRGTQFFLSWWAYSFPTAAFTIASMLMYRHSGLAFFGALSWLMLAVLTAIIALLLFKTMQAAMRGEICVEE